MRSHSAVPFSLDYFPFSIGSYILLLVSFIMRLQNEDFAIRQRVAEKGSDNFFAFIFTYNTTKQVFRIIRIY